MKLIVGLGNPGRKYQGTRHNIGFDVLDELARKHDVAARKRKFEAEVAEVELAGQRTVLLWPQTYMNLSGTSVGKISDYYGLLQDDLLVVCDDYQLPLGKLRFRAQGSAGGQKGLADVIRRLGSEQFARLRIGVGPLPDRWDAADFVLGQFGRSEGAAIEQAVWRAVDGVVDWLAEGTPFCMNRYNG